MAVQIPSNEKALMKLGYLEEDFKKPLVGIIYASNNANSNLTGILENVKSGVISSGGNAIVLACPTLESGILYGDRYEMPARELIADTVECYCLENGFDALVLVADSDIMSSGLIMGACRVNIACTYISALCGKMACVGEVLGISLNGNGTLGNFSSDRLKLASMTGKNIMAAFNNQLTIKKIINKDSLKNALKFNLSVLSSVNVLLSLFAIAAELKISEKDFSVDILNATSDTTPTLCKRCNGFYEKLNAAGGVIAALKELNAAAALANTTTINNTALLNNIKKAENLDSEFIRKADSAYFLNSSLVLVKGNLAENGAFCKRLPFPKDKLSFTGSAKVYDSLETVQYAITSGSIKNKDVIVIKFEGAKGSGIREMDLAEYLKKANFDEVAIITDGRIKGELNCLTISCVSPEGLNGGNIGVIQNGDLIEFNILKFSFNTKVGAKDLDKRQRQAEMPDRQLTGYLKRYSAAVSDSVKGAYLK